MTTAPELPVPLPVSLPTSTAPAERRALRVLPALAEPIVDFDEALRRAGPRLQRYAVRRLHDPHEAEEIVQEALLRAFQHREHLATEDDLMAWLTVVTGRLVIDRLRVRGRSTPVVELPPASRTARDTADVVVARDEARIALDALEAMPTRQASVLWAREVEGLSYEAIGRQFALTEPSVRSVLHRARKTLRREYALRGGSAPALGLIALAPWLHGLRTAGKLRSVARRATTAATVSVAGLAAVSAVPFVLPDHHAPATPAMSPALGVRTVAQAQPHGHRDNTATRRVHGPTMAAPGAVAPTSTVLHLTPPVCRGDNTVGCRTHKSHALFVHLPVPVAGQDWVWVSTDQVDCSAVPSTPVAECDHHEGMIR